jgi:hypothetical protein
MTETKREVWTAPTVERAEPARVQLDERASLEAWMDYHRATLLQKCAGLTAGQLKERAVPPSSLSLLGLIRHMTEVERWWFRIHANDEPVSFQYSTDEWPDADFDDLENADAAADLERFHQEIGAARDAVRHKGLDHVVASRGHRKDTQVGLRWIYVHMIEEYARHNGHADLIRERIDGTTGM